MSARSVKVNGRGKNPRRQPPTGVSPEGRPHGLSAARVGMLLGAAALVVAVAVYVRSLRTPKETPLSGAVSANSAAYDAYLRGKVNVSSENPENNEAAIKLFQQA